MRTFLLVALIAFGALRPALADVVLPEENRAAEAQAALRADDAKTLKRLLDDGLSLTDNDESGTPLLGRAARLGQTDLVVLLIDRGAPTETMDANGDTALILAARAGQRDTVKALLARGAKRGAHGSQGGALDAAVKSGYGDVAALLADPKTDDLFAALAVAADAHDLASATVLLAHKAPTSRAGSDQHLLTTAIRNGDRALTQRLLAAGADIEEGDGWGDGALANAVQADDAALVKRLIAAHAKLLPPGATPPIVNAHSTAILDLLLAAGAKIDTPGPGSTEGTVLNYRVRNGDLAFVRVILGHKPRITASAMVGAAQANTTDLLELLLHAGGDPKAIDKDIGTTPLAAAVQVNRLAMISRLIDAGAPVDEPDAKGYTPITLTDRIDVASLLVSHGAHLDAKGEKGAGLVALAAARWDREAHYLDWLIAHGADPKAVDDDGRTALFDARGTNLDSLLAAGLDPAVKDHAGRTAAHAHAADHWALRTLYRAKADLGVADDEGVTPLHLAAQSSALFAVDFLLAIGVDPAPRTKDDKTPLDVATDERVKKVLRAVMAKRAKKDRR
jgi:ankyrin repeat protein